MYYSNLANDIEKYINDELLGSLYYKELSRIAPTRLVREILVEFSNDEKSHSESFKRAYYYLTGSIPFLNPTDVPEIPSFKEALKICIIGETRDYKKYGAHYIDAHNNYIKDLFFITKFTEAQHAMRIPMLLE